MTSIPIRKNRLVVPRARALGTSRARQAAMRRFCAVIVGAMLGACVLTSAASASAQTPSETFPKRRRTTQLFYGWEILVTGEAGGLLSAASIVLPDRPLSSAP